MNTRSPAVAGQFYPDSEKELRHLLQQIHQSELNKIDASYSQEHILGGIVPHAGYKFSAYEAAHFFENLRQSDKHFDTFVLIYPNHNIAMEDMSVDGHTHWETPLGNVKLDIEFGKMLNLPINEEDGISEHSGEVIVPLLQYFLDYPFQIVPVIMTNQNIHNAELLARLINNAQNETGRHVCVIASSDFSHFVEPKAGEELDNLVLEQVRKMNPIGVFDRVVDHEISICGYGPIMALMEYSKFRSEEPRADILSRGNSAKTYPSNEVVDYVSMIFYEPDTE